MSRIAYSQKDRAGSMCDDYVYKRHNRDDPVADYVAGNLSARGHGNELDFAERNIDLTKEALGRLVEILADKGILDIDEVLKICAEPDEEDEEADHHLLAELPA